MVDYPDHYSPWTRRSACLMKGSLSTGSSQGNQRFVLTATLTGTAAWVCGRDKSGLSVINKHNTKPCAIVRFKELSDRDIVLANPPYNFLNGVCTNGPIKSQRAGSNCCGRLVCSNILAWCSSTPPDGTCLPNSNMPNLRGFPPSATHQEPFATL